MKRTPALVAAAAAFGLLSGLGLQARADALTREVSPHMVSVAWLSPGATSPGGLEMEGSAGRVAPAQEPATHLPPMRARVPGQGVDEGGEPPRIERKEFAHRHACPREQAREAAIRVVEVHRS